MREKIEARYANALGQAELAQTSVEGRMLEVQKATLDVAGASRLEQIRAAMGGAATPPAVEGGAAAPAAVEGGSAAGALEEGTPHVQQPAAQPEAQPADRPQSGA